MHLTCMKWLEYCRDKYPEHFNDCRVLEMGSMNINGSVRKYFTNCEHLGVDWMPGLNVDIVSLAHEVKFNNKKFKTVISSSMLEHDPYWEKSLINMIDLLQDDGGLFLTWGGIGNRPHCIDTAPDNDFHALKGSLVFDYLINKGLYIHEFGGEEAFMEYLGLGDIDLRIAIGSINLIGFKKKYTLTGQLIFKLNKDNI